MPPDAQVLVGLHAVAKRMESDGLKAVWQPKTLARFLADAVKAASRAPAGSKANRPQLASALKYGLHLRRS